MTTAPIPPQSAIGVIGAGAMGAGIAEVALLAGHEVRLFDTQEKAIARAIEDMHKRLRRQAEKGRLDASAAAAAIERLQAATSLTDFADCALVVEAVVERVEVKRSLFTELEAVVRERCLLASNTSSLSITALAAGMTHPGRLVGMHFFNPAQVLPLVEVVSGLETEPWARDAVYRIAESWGKKPVHTKSSPGFIVNRVARPFYGEGLRLLEEGAASVATIDAVMREAGGFRMGPFELMDMIGLDVNLAVTQSVFAACFNDPRYAPSFTQQELVAAGRFGRKSGRGFYDYAESALPPKAAEEAPAKSPTRVGLAGDLGVAQPLVERLATVGVDVVKLPTADAAIGVSYLLAGTAVIALSDGRSATQRAQESGHPNFIVFDLAHDFAKAKRLAIARADGCGPQAYQGALGLLQIAGYTVSRLDDVPGLAVMRTLAMLANEAAELLHRHIASREDLDLAMQLGTNYPSGPLAWAGRVGLPHIRAVLSNLAAHYGEDRYRVSSLIQRQVFGGRNLDASD